MERLVAEAYGEYQRRLRRANAFDFDDLISSTVAVLQLFPDVAEHYRRRFRHVLVDEYQDTNHAQYVLVKRARRHRDTPDAAGRAAVRRRRRRPVDLRLPRRHDPQHRGVRARLPERHDDPARAELPLDPDDPHGGQRRHRAQRQPAREAAVDRRRARASRSSPTSPTTSTTRRRSSPTRSTASPTRRRCKPSDVAVFYRTNAQSRSIEEIFIRVGLPYRVVGGTRFYERREVRDAIAYLRALANPADEVSLRRILNTPKRGIGDRAEAMVEAFGQRERIGFARGARARRGGAGHRDPLAGRHRGVRRR